MSPSDERIYEETWANTESGPWSAESPPSPTEDDHFCIGPDCLCHDDAPSLPDLVRRLVEAGEIVPVKSDALPDDSPSLSDLVSQLVDARHDAANADAIITRSRALWDSDHAAALSEQREARDARERAEVALRDAIHAWAEAQLAEHGEDAPKHHPDIPGIGWRKGENIDYDPAEAFFWAKCAGRCLALDAEKFENLARLRMFEDVTALCTFEVTITPTIAAVLEVPG